MKKIKVIPITWVPEKHDSDNDGIPNFADCNFLNPFEQGRVHDFIRNQRKKIQRKRDLRRETSSATVNGETVKGQWQNTGEPQRNISREEDEANQQEKSLPTVYIYAQVQDPRTNMFRWNMVAAIKVRSQEELLSVLQEIQSKPDVKQVTYSDKPSMARQLNMAEQKQRVSNYVERRGWKENVKQGLKSRDKLQAEKQFEAKLRQEAYIRKRKDQLYNPPTRIQFVQEEKEERKKNPNYFTLFR